MIIENRKKYSNLWISSEAWAFPGSSAAQGYFSGVFCALQSCCRGMFELLVSVPWLQDPQWDEGWFLQGSA